MDTLTLDAHNFRDALLGLGANGELSRRLLAFLAARHPGDQERLYHTLDHSLEVAGLAARCAGALNPPVPLERRALLVFAAALRDVDPRRPLDSPPRVAATVELLSEEREALCLISDFGERFGFTRRQVAALILATGHDADPRRRGLERALFRVAVCAAFPEEPEALEWGRALAYWEKAAAYVAAPELARRRVAALARELRAAAGGRGPSAQDLLAGSPRFLAGLRRDPLFATLPAPDRARFEEARARLA